MKMWLADILIKRRVVSVAGQPNPDNYLIDSNLIIMLESIYELGDHDFLGRSHPTFQKSILLGFTLLFKMSKIIDSVHSAISRVLSIIKGFITRYSIH